MTSISRRAAALAALVVVPMAGLAVLGRSGFTVVAALIWAAAGVGLALLFGRSVARRIRELTSFAEKLPDLGASRPQLHNDDDELGDLARAMSRLTPRIEAVLSGLSTELGRREAILASMNEGVLAVDARLQVSFCNESFTRVAGAPEIREGMPLIKVLRHPGLLELLQRVVDSGETQRQRIRMPARHEQTFEVYATPLDGHSARGALAILHDITPAERLERTKRDFVANVSHEFRTPLATITGYAETLLNGGLEDQENRRKFIEIIQANSVRLNNIAADLLTLSELEGGQTQANPAPIAVRDVIQGALSTLEPVARMNQVKLKALEVADVDVLGYRIRFEQALVNLLDNAIKFNKPGGEVTVGAARKGDDQIEICVADTGIGIPREDLSRIFERFYRVDKARSRQVGGTGLGLSIVRHAVELMNGSVGVESEVGKGSCFTITLPRHTN